MSHHDNPSNNHSSSHSALILERTKLVAHDDANVVLFENVLSEEDADLAMKDLATSLPWNVEMDNFGPQSRPTCYYGDSPGCVFCYVGLTLTPRPWTPALKKLRDCVAATCCLPLERLSACLVNYYAPGEGYIPWHYDEVRAHGETKTVASLSLGGPRRFQLRRRHDNNTVADLLLPSGSVLLMEGRVQEEYEHCLPLEPDQSPLRVSLTFRSIEPGFEHPGREMAADLCCTQAPSECTEEKGVKHH